MLVTELELIPRLLIAFIAGALIGWEREQAGKPAGLRTHALVALGSALAMGTGELLADQQESRVIQGIVTGVGFIGAGTILQRRGSVVGLTTAATVWAASTVGIAAGAGYYLLALTGAALTLIIAQVLKRFE